MNTELLRAHFIRVMIRHHAEMLRRRLFIVDWALDNYGARRKDYRFN